MRIVERTSLEGHHDVKEIPTTSNQYVRMPPIETSRPWNQQVGRSEERRSYAITFLHFPKSPPSTILALLTIAPPGHHPHPRIHHERPTRLRNADLAVIVPYPATAPHSDPFPFHRPNRWPRPCVPTSRKLWKRNATTLKPTKKASCSPDPASTACVRWVASRGPHLIFETAVTHAMVSTARKGRRKKTMLFVEVRQFLR